MKDDLSPWILVGVIALIAFCAGMAVGAIVNREPSRDDVLRAVQFEAFRQGETP